MVSLRRSQLAGFGVLVCTCAAAATGIPPASAGGKAIEAPARQAHLGTRLIAYERATWRWQRTMGVQLTPTAGRSLAALSLSDTRRTLRRWERLAHAARRRAQHPPHLAAWLCIHHYEGSWTDSIGPYYGGLQMDLVFQERYAGRLYRTKGTADHWTPLEQIWTAVRAARTRGFWPWLNTARACGLL